MHELGVCQSMLRQIEDIARREAADRVTSICVRIGPLSGVEAALLEQAFPIASAGTLAEDARLLVERLPVRIRCTDCSKETDAEPNRLVCASCGSYRTRLLSGDELILASVELVKDPESKFA